VFSCQEESGMTTTESQLDASELEQCAKSMCEEVALEPDREFHFETC
jgi:hypothetical protein